MEASLKGISSVIHHELSTKECSELKEAKHLMKMQEELFSFPINCPAEIFSVWSYLFEPRISFCLWCWHPSEYAEKAQKVFALHAGGINVCFLHHNLEPLPSPWPQTMGCATLSISNSSSNIPTYLAGETDCQGHCVYRIPFSYSSNIP